MNELPDIPGFSHVKPSVPPTKHSNRSIGMVLSVFIAVLMSSAITVTCVLIGKEKILTVFGYIEPPKPDILLPVNKKIEEVETAQIEFIQSVSSQIQSLKSEVETNSLKKDQLNTRLSLLENSTSEFRQEIHAKITAERKKQQAIVRQQTQVQPKPIIAPVTIVSIRGWGNESYVTLKEGLDYSELLAVGDSWRGWTLLSADTNSRKATFRVQDQVKDLVM